METFFVANISLSEVFLIKTTDRNLGVKSLLSHFDLTDFAGKHVALKANFNSADPFPASTQLRNLASHSRKPQASKRFRHHFRRA